jgi:hypothetical protein
MALHRAQVISKPKDATVLAVPIDGLPVFGGEPKGTETVLCGTSSCDAVIARDVWPGTIKAVVVLCPKCQGYNLINV